MTRANPLMRGIEPSHPGAMLREVVLPALAKPKAEIARLLGVSRQALYDILSERQPITPAMALRIGKLCGNGPDLWLAMQRTYDLDAAEKELAARLRESQHCTPWYDPQTKKPALVEDRPLGPPGAINSSDRS